MASKKRQTILLHGASQASPAELRFVRFQGHVEPNNHSDTGHKKRQIILPHVALQASTAELRFARFQGHVEPNNHSDTGHKKRQIILLHGALRSLRASHRGATPATAPWDAEGRRPTAGGGNPGDMENGLSALFVTNIAKERL